jgi:transposase
MGMPPRRTQSEAFRVVANIEALRCEAQAELSQKIEVDPVWWSPSGFSEEASQMPKTRPPYAPEFRRQMVELVRAGRDPAELAREFEPTAQSISHWVAQADRQEGRREEKGNRLSAAEREELARLRRENKQLRLERDILSRAAAWFARETGAIPPGSSNS